MQALAIASPYVDPGIFMPNWVDLLGIATAALFGGAYMARRGASVPAVLLCGVIVGLAGGVIRDLLLGLRPSATTEPWYVTTAATAAFLGALLWPWLNRVTWSFLVIDSVFTGIFMAIAADRAILHDSTVAVTILIAFISGVGSGIVLDVVTGVTPRVLSSDHWLAFSVAVAAFSYVALLYFVTPWIAAPVAIAFIVFFRLVAEARQWKFPFKFAGGKAAEPVQSD